jgi:hypothetical protein
VAPSCPGPCTTPGECASVDNAYCLGTTCRYPSAYSAGSFCNNLQSICDGDGNCVPLCNSHADCGGGVTCCCHTDGTVGDPTDQGGCFDGGQAQCTTNTFNNGGKCN